MESNAPRIVARTSNVGAGTVRRPYAVAVLGALLVAALVLVPGQNRADATSPGTNGKIYFEQTGSIFSISPSGTNKQKIIPAKLFSGLVEAIPSPNGRKVAFTANNGGSDIWVKNLRSGAYKNVTKRASDDLTLTTLQTPAWSPDGSKLVFQATRKQRSRLYRINADGTRIKELMYFGDLVSGSLSPDWSSTNRIVFAYQGDLHTIKQDGSALTNVTEDEERGFERPSWSPDGTQIAADIDGSSFAGGGIMIVRPDPGVGQEKYNYITGDELNSNSEVIDDPSWSPDGQSIVYYGHWAPTDSSFEDYDLWKIDIANPNAPVDLNARDQFGDDVYHPNWAPQPS